MKKSFLLFTFLIFYAVSDANDGTYTTSGNQLIPIFETDISIKKEILTLKKINNQYIEVTVYYEFYNPKEEKYVIVGFEAFSPFGDVETKPRNGYHPYMSDFTVKLNDKISDYKVAYVSDSLYARNGMINGLSEEDIYHDDEYFYYVYHFNAKFKKGINILRHTYKYDLSSSVLTDYDFEYILTAAKRWANRQIDDFTLILDMGEFESFYVNRTFFNDQEDWKIEGLGKSRYMSKDNTGLFEKDAVKFNIQKGKVSFHQMNFKPVGELYVYSPSYYGESNVFDYRRDVLPFSIYQQDRIDPPKDEISKKVLRNLPFARRGYVFKTLEIQDYYENKVDWYIPNKMYKADLNSLKDVEKELVLKWRDD